MKTVSRTISRPVIRCRRRTLLAAILLPAAALMNVGQSAGATGAPHAKASGASYVSRGRTDSPASHDAAPSPNSSQQFTYKGTATQHFVVPPAVTQIVALAIGGHGGSGFTEAGGPGGSGGAPASAAGTISVTPGQTLSIEVGGAGGDGTFLSSGTGGNGPSLFGAPGGVSNTFGGAGGGGGAASAVLLPDDSFLVAAAGGGGGGGGGGFVGESGGAGGAGGYPPGGSGASGTGSDAGAGGAGGGRTLQTGGRGAGSPPGTDGGGGGGGGGGVDLTGGGGGNGGGAGGAGAGGGGGGGAGDSYVGQGAATYNTAATTGNGEVILYWNAPQTSTTLTGTPPSANGSVTFQATVNLPAGVTTPAPTGQVDFYDGYTLIGTAPLSATPPYTAGFSTNSLIAGDHSITASYVGDSIYEGSTSAAKTETIVGTTATTLALSSNPALQGQTITLTATVSGFPAAGPPPRGRVSFGPTKCGTVFQCVTATLNGKNPDQAAVTVPVAKVTPGAWSTSAKYLGSSIYKTSKGSASLNVLAPSALTFATGSSDLRNGGSRLLADTKSHRRRASIYLGNSCRDAPARHCAE